MNSTASEWSYQYYANQANMLGISIGELNKIAPVKSLDSVISGRVISADKLLRVFRLLEDLRYQEQHELHAVAHLFSFEGGVPSALISNLPDVASLVDLMIKTCQYNSGFEYFHKEIQRDSVYIYSESRDARFDFHSRQSLFFALGTCLHQVFGITPTEYEIEVGVTQGYLPDEHRFNSVVTDRIRVKESRAYLRMPIELYVRKNKFFNPLLKPYMDSLFQNHFPSSNPQQVDLLQQVNAQIESCFESFDSRLSIERVAQQLNMSRSTLYRQLSGQNVTFKNLVEMQRKKLALKYVSEKKMSLTQVSDMLGYAHVSAFNRAFNRWFNVSPSLYR